MEATSKNDLSSTTDFKNLFSLEKNVHILHVCDKCVLVFHLKNLQLHILAVYVLNANKIDKFAYNMVVYVNIVNLHDVYMLSMYKLNWYKI